MKRDAVEWGGGYTSGVRVYRGVEAFVSLPSLMVTSVEASLILLYSQYAHVTATYIYEEVDTREEVDPHEEANSLLTRN